MEYNDIEESKIENRILRTMKIARNKKETIRTLVYE